LNDILTCQQAVAISLVAITGLICQLILQELKVYRFKSNRTDIQEPISFNENIMTVWKIGPHAMEIHMRLASL